MRTLSPSWLSFWLALHRRLLSLRTRLRVVLVGGVLALWRWWWCCWWCWCWCRSRLWAPHRNRHTTHAVHTLTCNKVGLLLSKGADDTKRDFAGKTPCVRAWRSLLHESVACGWLGACQSLRESVWVAGWWQRSRRRPVAAAAAVFHVLPPAPTVVVRIYTKRFVRHGLLGVRGYRGRSKKAPRQFCGASWAGLVLTTTDLTFHRCFVSFFGSYSMGSESLKLRYERQVCSGSCSRGRCVRGVQCGRVVCYTDSPPR